MVLAIVFMAGAIMFDLVTLVHSEQYRTALALSAILLALSDYHIIHTFKTGTILTKIISLVLMLPTLFLVSDYIRRVPYLLK
jgi:hypothetical protein